MGRLIAYDFSGVAPHVTLTLGHPDESQDRVCCTKRHPEETQGLLFLSGKAIRSIRHPDESQGLLYFSDKES